MQQITLTQTGLGRLRACPKLFKLRHLLGWELIYDEGAENMQIGTDWHGALENAANGKPVAFDEASMSGMKFKAMFDSYRFIAGLVPKVAQEVEFSHPIINPETGRAAAYATMAGKIDGLCKDDNGEMWLVEHKTASDIAPGFIGKLSLDFQVHVYANYAKELLGEPVAGVVYDVVKKCKLLGKKNETPEEFYTRVMEWYQANAESAFYRERLRLQDRDIEAQLWMYYQEILWRSNNDYWPRNSSTCMNFYGRRCPFFSYCDSGDNQLVLQNSYEQKRDSDGNLIVNPELTQNLTKENSNATA